MKRYKITWNGRTAIRHGKDCDDAIEKYAHQNLFGKGVERIFALTLRQYDADTRGEMWAEYDADGKRAIVVIEPNKVTP